MQRFTGIGISSGLCIGKAVFINPFNINIKKKKISKSKAETELERFRFAAESLITEIDSIIVNFAKNEEDKEILEIHKIILIDPALTSSIEKIVTEDLVNLEHAIWKHFNQVISYFAALEDSYLSSKASDYKDVSHRLLQFLAGSDNEICDSLTEDNVVFIPEIFPSILTKLIDKKVRGLVTEQGGKNAHCAILARSFNLPMISGIKELEKIPQNSNIIMDGDLGYIIVEPDAGLMKQFRANLSLQIINQEKLHELIDVPTVTKDNIRIHLKSNIEIPEELTQVLKYKSEGIGLFRTEFLYMDRDKLPTELEQIKIYKDIAVKIHPHVLTIRTIDVGGDKIAELLAIKSEENPNLGCRGIRFSLAYETIFKVQLRAILKASILGNIQIMFPMVTSTEDYLRAKTVLQSCQTELETAGIAYDKNIKAGAMIEIPSAALISGQLAEICDFFSIGTNDLTQYTLAADRGNEAVNEYYDSYHPAVLHLIKMVGESALKRGIPLSVCGELAANPEFTKYLLGVGVTELSMTSGKILQIKKRVLSLAVEECKEFARQITLGYTSGEIKSLFQI